MTEAPRTPAPHEHLVWCRVAGPTPGALREFLDATGADPGCRPVARQTADGVEVLVEITRARLDSARASRADLVIEELEDLTDVESRRRAEVGRGDRFAARGAVPHGVGRKE